MLNKKSKQIVLPNWAQGSGFSEEDWFQIIRKDLLPQIDEKDKMMYESISHFSNRWNLDFILCCSHALDLYLKEDAMKRDVSQYLSEKLEISKNFQKKELPQKSKTILLLGDTGQGKSLLVNHLIGKYEAKVGFNSESQTKDVQLFFSQRCNLNIIDTEGFDGTSQKLDNDELMKNILLHTVYCLEFGASIDAIVVMWCPLKSGKSGIVKTLNLVEKIFGKKALDSCIAMIQGDWEPLAEVLDLTQAVPAEIHSLKTKFPNMQRISYDAKGSFEMQFNRLKGCIDYVQPYRKECFEEMKKEEFFYLIRFWKFRIQKEFEKNLPDDRREEEIKKLLKNYQSGMLKSLLEKEKELQEKQSMLRKYWASKDFKFAFWIDNFLKMLQSPKPKKRKELLMIMDS